LQYELCFTRSILTIEFSYRLCN